jgi:hypothetical protein
VIATIRGAGGLEREDICSGRRLWKTCAPLGSGLVNPSCRKTLLLRTDVAGRVRAASTYPVWVDWNLDPPCTNGWAPSALSTKAAKLPEENCAGIVSFGYEIAVSGRGGIAW